MVNLETLEVIWLSLGRKDCQLVAGYKAEDIWNVEETGCFWRSLPDKGLGQMKMECKGGKESKHSDHCILCQWCGRI